MTMSPTPSAQPITSPNYRITSAVLSLVLLRANDVDELEVLMMRSSTFQPGRSWRIPDCTLLPSVQKNLEDTVHAYLQDTLGTRIPCSPTRISHVRIVGAYPQQDDTSVTGVKVMIVYCGIAARRRGHETPIVPEQGDSDLMRWIRVDDIRNISVDEGYCHAIGDALKRIDEAIGYGRKSESETELIFEFLPERFSLAQAQAILEAIKRKAVDSSNFRKFFSSRVRETDQMIATRTKPAVLFERDFDSNTAAVTPNAHPVEARVGG
jgi:hypothetical protein